MHVVKRFGFALSYVTALPFLRKPLDHSELQGLSKYLPAVGLVLGLLLVGTWHVLSLLHVPVQILSVAIVLAWVAITGGIHLDGLMDTADGVFSHRSRERMLQIMRDSRTGNFGAITGILLLLSKYAGLSAISNAAAPCILILVPVWARWSEVVAIASYPYAREQGMGKVWHDTTGWTDLLISLIVPALVTCLSALIFPAYFWIIVATCAGTLLFGALCMIYTNSLLGGQTGDTYGATVEIAEAGGLVCGVIAASLLRT